MPRRPVSAKRPRLQRVPSLPRRPTAPARSTRFRTAHLIATLHRVSEVLETVVEADQAAWAALVALTAGEGLGFNRAFLLLLQGEELRGLFGVGPRSREEAAAVWAEIRQREVRPLEKLARPDPLAVEGERTRHTDLLARLSHTVANGCAGWRRAFVGRANHPNPCVRHWIGVLDSEALAVLPMMSSEGPWGVVIADNFVTRAPIVPATLEAAQTIVHALRAALERTRLLDSLHEEQRRLVAAEHATTLLETARTLAHDLKNPLALAGGLARELLNAPLPAGDSLFKHLAIIAAAVQQAEERLAQLADGLASQVSKVSLAALEVGEVVDRVAAAFRPLADSRGIRLVFYRPARALVAVAEPSLLERCVENLIGNGLEALREARTPSPVLRVAVFENADEVNVEIADNGPPLPGLLRADPFSGALSGPRSGTGLGLVSVRRLVDAMSGRVEYDEREPGWVRFTVHLRRSG